MLFAAGRWGAEDSRCPRLQEALDRPNFDDKSRVIPPRWACSVSPKKTPLPGPNRKSTALRHVYFPDTGYSPLRRGVDGDAGELVRVVQKDTRASQGCIAVTGDRRCQRGLVWKLGESVTTKVTMHTRRRDCPLTATEEGTRDQEGDGRRVEGSAEGKSEGLVRPGSLSAVMRFRERTEHGQRRGSFRMGHITLDAVAATTRQKRAIRKVVCTIVGILLRPTASAHGGDPVTPLPADSWRR
jgi:hypothetical protein